jgi:molybdopterin-containing oxidoreductase family iron-sulfur binding subunit
MDDTTAMSDLVLPQHSPLEDWGTDAPDFGPGYEVVGFQQPVVRPFFEDRGAELGTRGFADVLLTMAQGLNLDLELGGESFKEVLQADAQKLFALGRGSVNASSFAGFWNGVLQRGGWWDVNARNTSPANVPPSLPDFEEPQFEGADRYRYHLTPFTQTGVGDGQRAHLPWMQATPDPITTATWRTWIEINLRLAEDLGIREGDVIKVTSPRGSIEALAYPHPGVPPSTVAIPLGQGHSDMGRYAKDRGANVFSILSTLTDTESGALAWAATKVNIEKMDDWVRVPKFENTVPELPQDDHNRVIEITEEDS